MANPKKRVPENASGDFFVDSTYIDCDAGRQIAPSVFGEAAEASFVKAQPGTSTDRRRALRELLQDAAPCREGDLLASLGEPLVPEDMGRGKCYMAANTGKPRVFRVRNTRSVAAGRARKRGTRPVNGPRRRRKKSHASSTCPKQFGETSLAP